METQALALTTFSEIERAAEVFIASGYFKGVTDVAKATVKILAGHEMGISPIAAMRGLDLVNDQITMRAHLMAAILKRSGRYTYRILENSNQVCSIEFFERGEKIGISEFTWQDATTAGLTGKGTWKSYPRTMLYNRAMSQGARMFCPDVFLGAVYADGEIDVDISPRRMSQAEPEQGDLTGIGDYIEGEAISVETESLIIPEGKRALLSKKLADLGWTSAQIDKRLGSIASSQELDAFSREVTARWEAKVKAAEEVFDGEQGEEDDVPETEYLFANPAWNPIFEAMAKAGVSYGEFESFLLMPIPGKRTITSVDDLETGVVKRYAMRTQKPEECAKLAAEVRRVLAQAKIDIPA